MINTFEYDATSRVRDAIAATDVSYWESICAQRSGRSEIQAGSYFPWGVTQISSVMKKLEWDYKNFVQVKSPCTAFVARAVTGFLNIAHISTISPTTVLTFEDRKETGLVEAVCAQGVVQPVQVDFVTIILGPDTTKGNRQMVYTFHPGAPVAPSEVKRRVVAYDDATLCPMEVDRHTKSVSVEDARALGVEWVRLRR